MTEQPRVIVPGIWSDILGNKNSQGNGYLRTGLVFSDGEVSVQNPLPTNGDRVYCKDIWDEQSTSVDFTGGTVDDLFNNLHTSIINETSNNPKEIFVHFNSTTATTVIAFGAHTGNFSNVKISALVSGPVEMTIIDESADNTKHTSRQYDLPAIGFNAIRIQFHTSDDVSLSNIFIAKSSSVIARIQGQKPDETFVEFQSTQSGNFKVSLEEFENDVSTNSNSQLNVSPYLVDEFGVYSHMLGDNMFQGSPVVIDSNHHEIHCGDSYELTYVDDMENNGTVEILIIVPNEPGTGQAQKLYHLKQIVDTEAEATVEIFEGTTYSSSGTSISSFNRNRNSSFNDFLGVTHTPTITSDGTQIFIKKVGSGRGTGGVAGRESEIVLRNNETYLIRISNDVATQNYCNVELDYYVHPGI